ncbi:MAG: pyridoxal-phosphate dependent enzyme [Alkalispirochaeta sp.]
MQFTYRCIQCGREYPVSADRLVCEECSRGQRPGMPPAGMLEVRLIGDPGTPDGRGDTWDVQDLLPVEKKWFPPIPVGNTPLWEPARLRKMAGLPQLFLKDDTANPTGSLKDRASYLVAAFARREGIDRIVLSSTGNAGSSMCGIGAAAGLHVRLYLPAAAPPAKIVQSLQYGAEVIKVDGTYDDAHAESVRYLAEHGGLSRNTGHNPLTVEGKKTVSLEIFRQLGHRVPDYIFVPVGDGVILSGVYKGFEDLIALGLADRMPTVVAVQAEGSSAIARAFKTGEFDAPRPANTVADSISVDVPAGGYFALGRLQRHNGKAVVVSDEDILQAQYELASMSGLFAEPAASAAWAGCRAMNREIDRDATVVVLVTGSGLKDIDAARKGVMLHEHH